MNATMSLRAGDALIIVDVQNDFLPGGALAVPHGDLVVPVLNGYIAWFVEHKLPVFATRDWHPANHCSFRTQGGPWPRHCVMYTYGANAPPQLKLPADAMVIEKPCCANRETYSPFEGTDFEQRLRAANVRRLFVGGLATDYCVLHTILDARQRGFEVVLLQDAVRAVNVRPEDGRKAEDDMRRAGAVTLELTALVT